MSVTSFRADLGTPRRSTGAERPRQVRGGPNGRSVGARGCFERGGDTALQSVVPELRGAASEARETSGQPQLSEDLSSIWFAWVLLVGFYL